MTVCPRSLADLVECDLNLQVLNPVQRFQAHALRKSLTKKLVTGRSPRADLNAIEKFLSMNERCKNFELRVESSWDEELVGTFKRVLYDFFYPRGMPLIEASSISAKARTGPGAAVDAQGTSFYEKMFSSKLSYTRRYILDLYKIHTKSHPIFFSARKGSERIHGYSIVDYSRLTTVPKENDIDRVICIEPSLNMYFQLGLGAILEDRLNEFFGIDLTSQPDWNRKLARLGSLTGSHATIDLSSASDCISLQLCRQVLPKSVFDWFSILRAPFALLPSGDKVELHMMSTMGNGFTFPLQTILFAAMVRAVQECYGKSFSRFTVESGGRAVSQLLSLFDSLRGDVPESHHDRQVHICHNHEQPVVQPLEGFLPHVSGVFGDDIVCGRIYFRRVTHLLRLLGFTPNPNKTFNEGPFRESCGSDWLNGHQTRGVYIKDLSTTQGRFIAINALNRWSAETGILLYNTIQYLKRSVPNILVPYGEGDYAGIKVPSSLLCGSGASVSYRCFEPVPLQFSTGLGPLRRRNLTHNPHGLWISFLRGEIRSGKLTVRRSGKVRYRYARKLTPNWDRHVCVGDSSIRPDEIYLLIRSSLATLHGWSRWKSVTEANVS